MFYCKNNLVTLKFSSKCSVNTGMSIESLSRYQVALLKNHNVVSQKNNNFGLANQKFFWLAKKIIESLH